MDEQLSAQMINDLNERDIQEWKSFLKSHVVQKYFSFIDQSVNTAGQALLSVGNSRDQDMFLKGRIYGLKSAKDITNKLTKLYERGSRNGPDKTKGVEEDD